MNLWSAKLLLLLAMVVPVTQPPSPQPSASQGGNAPSAAAPANPQARNIRISAPLAGQQLASNVIAVRYELLNPAASAGAPNFRLQIDGLDPVSTRDTQYTFTGLAPGDHTVTVTLVDANGTPAPGGRAEVQFKTPAPSPTGAASPSLPSGGSPLPILSLIGFGVLIWQGFVAMRSRA